MITTWYGVFLIEEGEILDDDRFPEDPDAIADRLAALESGEILDEEQSLVADREAFLVIEDRLMHLEGATFAELDVMPDAVEKQAPDRSLLRQASMDQAEEKATDVGDDQLLVQAVEAMDELQRIENLIDERLTEWTPLHEDADGDQDAAVFEEVTALGDEVGTVLADVEDHVVETVEQLAPNVSQLATPGVAARLIAKAGGLEELARMPSGTIQTLGAEDALFAHLTQGASPPKHGIIYQNPEIHGAPYPARGKISRAMANKIAIAARADAYTGGEIADQLVEELQARIEDVREQV